MPIGPSHSGRGGSGSSGGSGSRGRSSSSGGNLLGAIIGGVIGGAISSRRRERRRERYYGGGHHNDHYDNYDNEPATPSRKKPTAFLVLAIITLFITIFTFSVRNGFIRSYDNNNSYVKQMETEQKEWAKHLSTANTQKTDIEAASGEQKATLEKKQTHFITTGTFTKNTIPVRSYGANPQTPNWYEYCNINNNYYYFIVYSFDYRYYDNIINEWVEGTEKGTTYAQYSQSNVPNGTLNIIYYVDDNGKVQSMDVAFANTTLNAEQGEYGYTFSLAEGTKLLANNTIWVIVVEILLIALFVFIYVKKLKKYKALVKQDEEAYSQKQQAEVSEAQAKAETAQKEADQKNRVCSFCGCTVPDGEPNCPSCGSSTFE